MVSMACLKLKESSRSGNDELYGVVTIPPVVQAQHRTIVQVGWLNSLSSRSRFMRGVPLGSRISPLNTGMCCEREADEFILRRVEK